MYKSTSIMTNAKEQQMLAVDKWISSVGHILNLGKWTLHTMYELT